MTSEQLAHEWIATTIRPDSTLIRLRVDPFSNLVLASQTLNLEKLTAACNENGFLPAEELGKVHTFLSDLIGANLKEGDLKAALLILCCNFTGLNILRSQFVYCRLMPNHPKLCIKGLIE